MPAGTTTIDGFGAAAQLPSRAMLLRPLEYLLVEHLRHRNLCWLLEQLAQAPALDGRVAEEAADRLSHELAVHALDDEEDLYPLVRRRAEPEDRVEDVLGALADDHAEEDRLLEPLADALRRAAGAERLDDGLRAELTAFAARLRRRLAVENALVMPLAERRLTAADLAGLSRRMAARRGIQLARELRHA